MPRCQMGKIKYRHETGRHQGNKRNTAGRESESQSQERNVSFTPLTFFRQFGRKALTMIYDRRAAEILRHTGMFKQQHTFT